MNNFYYSKSTNGFYCDGIHGDNLPEDVVEISEKYYNSLLSDQSDGKVIVSDEVGYPISIVREQSEVEILNVNKQKAKKELMETDFSQLADIRESLKNKDEFDNYRKVIRQIYINPTVDVIWLSRPEPVWL